MQHVFSSFVASLIICLGLGLSADAVAQTHPGSSHAVANVDASQLTPARQEWVGDYFVPKVLNGWAADYPVKEVRDEYNALVRDLRAEGIIMQVLPKHPDSDRIQAGIGQKDGRPTMAWYMAGLKAGETDFTHGQWLDRVVISILHEGYHLTHPFATTTPTRAQQIQEESAAWWYTMEKVVVPMRRGGRMDPYTPDIKAIAEAYETAHGDPNHRAWKNLMATLVPNED